MRKSICCAHIGKRQKYEDDFLFNGIYLTSDMQNQISDNFDYFISNGNIPDVGLFAISDGMGGHNAGEVASRICVEKLMKIEKNIKQYNSVEDAVSFLQTVICEINDLICELSHKYSELKGMGTTLILLLIFREEYAVLNIGDSRAYHFDNGTLTQISKDHTEGQRMLDLGLLTRKELLDFPARKYLNRYIGFDQKGYVLQADEYYPVYNRGIILLCSDGISDFISESRIAEILCMESDIEIAGKQIIGEVVKAHNADNATLIIVPIRGETDDADKFDWKKYSWIYS